MPSKPAELSLEDCIRLAIGNSYEIKLARLDFLIAETDLDAARAAFDTVFSADINYSIDKKKQLSVFGGAKSTESNYEVSAAKKLPTGTKITPSFKDTRTWTDSSYVSANPAHTAQAGVEIRQPIANNAFGYNDRRRITTAKIAIQNAGLDTKERIENLFAKIEKAYWQWVFSKESLKIHKEILNKARDLHKANERNYEM
ncbi:MAG: TolC family protein, partial [Candidatus Omnitrophota bacterium]